MADQLHTVFLSEQGKEQNLLLRERVEVFKICSIHKFCVNKLPIMNILYTVQEIEIWETFFFVYILSQAQMNRL